MIQPPFYCAELSRGSGEQVFGTASTGEVWLLVEYPYGWGAHALESSALSPAVKSHLSDLLKTIPRSRLLFIKQHARPDGRFNFFVVRAREQRPYVVELTLSDYEDLRSVNVAAIAAGESTGGGVLMRDPLYLVCTHGRRDKCCAKFGYALYKHLRERAGASVWQSSHVGGDRFAANLLCFPHGLFYAHVTHEAGARIMEEYGRGRIVLENYRGRACYTQQLQAAEYFVRVESGLKGLGELSHAGGARISANVWRFRFNAPAEERFYEAQVSSRASEFANFITCGATEAKQVQQFVLEEFRAADDPAHAR
ncbi:MAG: hypothetical protein QOF61_974 [Acidobacteriota bacterium]|jgi:hypothetical protein|nr:hypothetical protein [Acidobacteriota bacterium]